MTRSGGRSNSVSDDMQAGCFCVVLEIRGWNIVDGPVIHGSSSIVNGCGSTESATDSGITGSKESRNEASELRCFTVKAMVGKFDILTTGRGEGEFSSQDASRSSVKS
ncbi:hypothetical protein RRF57_008696 [Xylaria bambusicola]|uniref:Uncharacterized protein n=1 Tax=Xylaria bambusicola TaxID=326684 RepID=A0AAN7UPT7_9PEZI